MTFLDLYLNCWAKPQPTLVELNLDLHFKQFKRKGIKSRLPFRATIEQQLRHCWAEPQPTFYFLLFTFLQMHALSHNDLAHLGVLLQNHAHPKYHKILLTCLDYRIT